MPNLIDFETCVRANLKDRRFGKERGDAIVKEFRSHFAYHKSTGLNDSVAGLNALNDLNQRLTRDAAERMKRTAAMMTKQAQLSAHLDKGKTVDLKILDAGKPVDQQATSRGEAVARAAVALIGNNPRFGGTDFNTASQNIFGEFHKFMSNVLPEMGKGAWGRQKGKVHEPNVIEEAFGKSTGDALAADFWQAWNKLSDYMVDRFNAAGGSMNKLKNYLPQPPPSLAKMVQNEDAWRASRMDRWDWTKMRYPDGTLIPPERRAETIDAVWKSMTLDGANKIDPTAFRGQGRAIGNALEQHRFVHYKDAESWLADLKEFSDSGITDVFFSHIEDMTHKVAMIDTFGPSPEAMFANIRSMVRAKASEYGAVELGRAEAILKNKFDPMVDFITRSNPVDSESRGAAAIYAVANTLTAAQLGSAAIPAVLGDHATLHMVAKFNGSNIGGAMRMYLDGLLANPTKLRQELAAAGFVVDDTVRTMYAATRFNGFATMGPMITRHFPDKVLRASGMAAHTNVLRGVAQKLMLIDFARNADVPFDKLPNRDMMARHGVTSAEWDEFRKAVKPSSPREGVSWMRPIDLLDTELPNKQALFKKFQGLVHIESRSMVLDSSVEAAVGLKGTTRPDTLAGAILHSFAMYKNFAVAFWLRYGRLGMSGKSAQGRLGFYAALGTSMTLMGALGIQIKELRDFKDPVPMDTLAFWGRAMLAGGALSIWGDFLTSGVNRMGGGPVETAAGPIAGFAGDTAQLVLGDLFNWVDSPAGLSQGQSATFLAKAAQYTKRYTPGTNLWWAKGLLEKGVWENVENLADPDIYERRLRREQNQLKNGGNRFFVRPGESVFEGRLPEYQGSPP